MKTLNGNGPMVRFTFSGDYEIPLSKIESLLNKSDMDQQVEMLALLRQTPISDNSLSYKWPEIREAIGLALLECWESELRQLCEVNPEPPSPTDHFNQT